MIGELLVVDDVAGEFSDAVINYFGSDPQPMVLTLSGGATARRCYEDLASRTDPEFWSRLDVAWGDERCVPLDDEDSNYALAANAFGALLDDARSVHPMRCAEGADRYGRILHDLGGPGLVHLGLGPDGHTASLFPGSNALTATADVVLNNDPLGQHQHQRMTMTFPAISKASFVIVTVEGESKREALRRVINGDRTAPAARLDGPRLLWLVDHAALGDAQPR